MHKLPILLVLMLASRVEARELPSEIDLRAAYCISIVQGSISVVRSVPIDARFTEEIKEIVEETLSEMTADLRKLQLYLIPRIPHLAPLGLVAAHKSGEEDFVRFDKYVKTCQTKCEHLLNKPSWASCLEKCKTDNPLNTHLKACSDLSWLPF